MYWIDVNLLNDREDFAADFGPPPVQISDSKAPLAIGLGVGAAAIAIAFGVYSITGFFTQKLVAEEEQLDQKIARLGPQLTEVEEIETELKAIRAQTDGLAKIFNQIKPWSAMLADLRDRVPSSLQITEIAQSGSKAPSSGSAKKESTKKESAPVATSSGISSKLKLKGSALSFGDVNDFVLTLRESNYLSQTAAETQLKTATRKTSKEKDSLVSYEIDTSINNAPADSLLTALRQNGASGLVSRIETLKRQGVIKK